LQGLTVIKRSAAILQFINLYSEDGSPEPAFITSYATVNVLDELSRGSGVGQVLAVRQAQLFHAGVVRHPTAHQPHLRRPTVQAIRPERPGAGPAASGRARSATTSNSR